MDEEDEKWLIGFNAKAEGASGTEPATSPLRESTTPNQPLAARERRGKGKEKEKDKERDVPTTLSISEDIFEYVMGMMEKYVEDTVPMLHTVSLERNSEYLNVLISRTSPSCHNFLLSNTSLPLPSLPRSTPLTKYPKASLIPNPSHVWPVISIITGANDVRFVKANPSFPVSTTTKPTMEIHTSVSDVEISEQHERLVVQTIIPSRNFRNFNTNYKPLIRSYPWFRLVND
jgi:hypothetical protein